MKPFPLNMPFFGERLSMINPFPSPQTGERMPGVVCKHETDAMQEDTYNTM